MSKFTDLAISDAIDMAENFRNEILEQIVDDQEVSDDLLNNYQTGDEYHFESHVDANYSLIEAAALLNDLDAYEETDSSIWSGLQPRDAISIQAAYTYGNAVYAIWRNIIEEINREISNQFDAFEEIDSIDNDDKKNSSKLELAEEIFREVIENFA